MDFAAILVRDVAAARQICITAVGIPISVTDLIRVHWGLKYSLFILMMERPDR